MPGNRTADHVLTLKTLHDKYENEKIYTCFVDFRKAVDSIWHQGLFYQLIKNNIGGHFYDLIQDIYSSTKCAIKLSDNRTPFLHFDGGGSKPQVADRWSQLRLKNIPGRRE
jgi:hypothetical protein